MTRTTNGEAGGTRHMDMMVCPASAARRTERNRRRIERLSDDVSVWTRLSLPRVFTAWSRAAGVAKMGDVLPQSSRPRRYYSLTAAGPPNGSQQNAAVGAMAAAITRNAAGSTGLGHLVERKISQTDCSCLVAKGRVISLGGVFATGDLTTRLRS